MTDQAQGLRDWMEKLRVESPLPVFSESPIFVESFIDYRRKLERLRFQNETLASLHVLVMKVVDRERQRCRQNVEVPTEYKRRYGWED